MSKVHNREGISLPSSEQENSQGFALVGLSNRANLTVQIVSTKYINGEGTIRIVERFKEPFQTRLPIRQGELVNRNGLCDKAKSKIKRACRCMQFLVKNDRRFRGRCSFITLTYGRDFPGDHVAKKHLDIFLKRARRLLKNFHYVWVAEKQKRGAIHFHIVTPNFIKKELINKMWNEVVGSWQIEMNCEAQTLLPNIKAVDNISGYVAKYLSKEGQCIKGNMYNMSALTRKLIRPIDSKSYDFPAEIMNDVLNDVYLSAKEKEKVKVKGRANLFVFSGLDYYRNTFLWTNDLEVLRERLDLIYEML